MTRSRRVCRAPIRAGSPGALAVACALAGVALAAVGPTASAQPAAAAARGTAPAFVTHHTGTFNGQTVRYTATVAATTLRDAKGAETASLYSIAYVRDDGPRASRPVLFLSNGGPGSASVWLHMGAFGPRRAVLPADVDADVTPPYRAVDNAYTVLDVADLVFIDPVGTGYSRLHPGADRRPFYTAAGDAASIADFVRAWTVANGREASPKFMLGESYGTIRAVLAAEALAKSGPPAALDGVVLLGQAVNIVETVQRAGNIVGYATNLPALAAIAHYHGRIDARGRSVADVIEEAWQFGMNEYLTALARGRTLPDDERRRVAAKLAELTGLSADFYLANGLMVSKERFRTELLRDKGLLVGMYDARYTGPLPAAGARAVDPSLKMSPAFEALLRDHLTTVLKVGMQEDYRTLDSDAADWDYGGPRSPFADYDFQGAIARVMAAQPAFRLMVGTGIYDTTTTLGPARYLVRRGAFPAERVSLRAYEGGHMAYTNEAALKALTDDVRRFMTADR